MINIYSKSFGLLLINSNYYYLYIQQKKSFRYFNVLRYLLIQYNFDFVVFLKENIVFEDNLRELLDSYLEIQIGI